MLKHLLWFLLLLLLTACQSRKNSETTISGKLTESSGTLLTLLEMDTQEMKKIDTVLLDSTEGFMFRLNPAEAGFWLLKDPAGKVLVMVIHPGDQIELSGSAAEFPDLLQLKGSEDAMNLHDFYCETRKEESLVDSLEIELSNHQYDNDYYKTTQKIDTLLHQIWERQRVREISYINRYPGSLSSLVVINYAFGMSPVISPEEDPRYFLKLDSSLTAAFPENKHVKYHHQRVLGIKQQQGKTNHW
jgi:hypothetical protein